MTIDEAIKHAEEVAEENSKSYEEWLACKNRGNVGWSKSDIEAVDKSIEQCKKCAEEHRQLAEWLKDYKRLLEQEPCEGCISRQAAINAFNAFADEVNQDTDIHEAIEIVLNLPPIAPAEKVGHWIIYDIHGHKACKCSKCGMDVGYPCNDKFCKHCGAKMQEVEE